MSYVKKVYPDGKVEFTRTYYVTFALLVVLMVEALLGLVTACLLYCVR